MQLEGTRSQSYCAMTHLLCIRRSLVCAWHVEKAVIYTVILTLCREYAHGLQDARQVLDLVSRPELRLRVLRVLEQGGLSHMAEHYKSLYFDLSR